MGGRGEPSETVKVKVPTLFIYQTTNLSRARTSHIFFTLILLAFIYKYDFKMLIIIKIN